MNIMSRSITVLFVGFVLTGCLKTRSELSDMRSSKEVQAQQIAAKEEIKQEEVDGQIRSLVGRIDILENQLATVAEKVVTKGVEEQQTTEKKVARLDALEKAIEKMDLKLMALSNEIRVYLKSAKKKVKTAPKAPKGNYARAETDFSGKRWKEAIVGYEKYRELNPKGRRYAQSTYKIGVCFQELAMGDAAKSFFQEVLDRYPKSSMAKKARYRLSKLK